MPHLKNSTHLYRMRWRDVSEVASGTFQGGMSGTLSNLRAMTNGLLNQGGKIMNMPVAERTPMASWRGTEEHQARRSMPLVFGEKATQDIAREMNGLLADAFALYLKTKNFHWHMSGPHFRDYHELLDEQAGQLLAMTDPIAERVRKLGGRTLHSIGEISNLQRVRDNDDDFVLPVDMLSELAADNRALAAHLRAAHEVCGSCGDVASTSLIEGWIDEAERRAWFLFEAGESDSGATA